MELPLALEVEVTVLGGPKNEVMDPLPLGFLTSPAGSSEPFRLRLRLMMRGRRTLRDREDTLLVLERNCEVEKGLEPSGSWNRIEDSRPSRVPASVPKLVAGGN